MVIEEDSTEPMSLLSLLYVGDINNYPQEWFCACQYDKYVGFIWMQRIILQAVYCNFEFRYVSHLSKSCLETFHISYFLLFVLHWLLRVPIEVAPHPSSPLMWLHGLLQCY